MVTSWNALKTCIKCQPDSKRFCFYADVIIEYSEPSINRENVKWRLHRCNHLPPGIVQKALLIVSDICMSSTAHVRGAPSMSRVVPPVTANIFTSGCFFVVFASFLIYIVLKLLFSSQRRPVLRAWPLLEPLTLNYARNSKTGGWIMRTAKHLAKQKC